MYYTTSTGTVHTSAKAPLTSVAISVQLSVVGRWCNDVIVAMTMPVSACPTLRRCTAQSVENKLYLSIVTNPENNPYIQIATEI